MKPSGLPKEVVDKLTYDMGKNIANGFKQSNLINKEKASTYFADLRSGNPVLVEQAILNIEAIFDSEIADSDRQLVKLEETYNKNNKPVVKDQ